MGGDNIGTHSVRTDCPKCKTENAYVYSFDTKNTIRGEAFCLNCGIYYMTVEKRLSKRELQDFRKEYEWKERDIK